MGQCRHAVQATAAGLDGGGRAPLAVRLERARSGPDGRQRIARRHGGKTSLAAGGAGACGRGWGAPPRPRVHRGLGERDERLLGLPSRDGVAVAGEGRGENARFRWA